MRNRIPSSGVPWTVKILLATLLAGPATGVEPGKLQEALDRGRAELEAHGACATVIRRDGSVWSGASGMADAGRKLETNHLFDLGSIGKTFTAAVILQLVSERALGLDDSIAPWFPGLEGGDRIHLRHLLNHTSGIPDAWDHPTFIPGLFMNPRKRWTTEGVLAFAKKRSFEPGKGWDYSSTGYLILGTIASRVTEKSPGTLYRDRLFKPLGLVRTFYAPEDEIPGARAHGFFDMNRDGEPEDITPMLDLTAYYSAAAGAGAVHSTAEETARWIRALVAGPVVDEAPRAELLRWVDRPDGNRHGLGVLKIDLEGTPLIGHRGNALGYSCAAWHAPGPDLTVVVLTNKHGVLVTPIVSALLRVAREAGQ